MESRHLDMEALQQMIKAVEKYQERIVQHYNVIQNAANLCDQAMGSDAISKKQIAKLYEASQELITTSEKAKHMAEQLILEYKRAEAIYDGI